LPSGLRHLNAMNALAFDRFWSLLEPTVNLIWYSKC
jgi:hypothetical protein